jgi:hypothetical protein
MAMGHRVSVPVRRHRVQSAGHRIHRPWVEPQVYGSRDLLTHGEQKETLSNLTFGL